MGYLLLAATLGLGLRGVGYLLLAATPGLGLRGVGYLLSAAAPDLGRGVTPLIAAPDLGRWVSPLPRSVGAQYATGDQWRNNSRKNEGMEPKQKEYPAMDVTGDRSKVQCYKEQYCIGTWNVRSMNQGKLEVVKQEMERVNVHILGISELKWTGMGEFNSDDHYIYYCGQESLRRNGVAIMVNKSGQQKSLKCSTWMQSQK